jgi:hypothetical protein
MVMMHKAPRLLGLVVAIAVAASTIGLEAAKAAPPSTAIVRLATQFDFTFQPGVWHGFALSSAGDSAQYLVEVSPLAAPSVGGGYFTSVVQQEFDDTGMFGWRDVARIQLLGATVPVAANVRIYAIGPK